MGFPMSVKRSAPVSNERWSWWVSLFVLCAILGALMGLSFKTQNKIRRLVLPSGNYAGLAEGYTVLKQELESQQRTIAALQQNTQKLQSSASSDTSQTRVLSEDLKQANFLAGLTAVQGPGVIVTLNDSKHTVPGAPVAAIMPNLIHDTDINAVVNELKAAGAEAISVNEQRLVATSPIRCAGPTVFVNNIPETPPYAIRAIGNSGTLMTAINLQGGVADQLRQLDPAMIKIEKAEKIIVPAFAGATQPRYAKPVPVSDSTSQTKD